MQTVDMRSDTVTRPSADMLAAMTSAELGDDVLGDDPTVLRLQERVAGLLGKEAAVYVPSGTMGNQLAVRAQAGAGDQVVLEDGAHIYRYEAGAPGALSGVQLTTVAAPGGVLDWPLVEAAFNPLNVHCAPPTLVCLENTHNHAGGRVLPQANVEAIAAGSHARGLRVHMDGARIWHAAVATGLDPARLAAPVDSISVCFSKGLGAPVGSVLAADRATVDRAYRFRKMWGGGMRQSGLLAAACLYALEHHFDDLARDHSRARELATGLANPQLVVNHAVETNIVIIDVEGPEADRALLTHLEAAGVRGVGFGPGRVRLVLHRDVPDDGVPRALEALNRFQGGGV